MSADLGRGLAVREFDRMHHATQHFPIAVDRCQSAGGQIMAHEKGRR